MDTRLRRTFVSIFVTVFLGGAALSTSTYFPPSELSTEWDVSARELFAEFLSRTTEPVLFKEAGVVYAVRVTAFRSREVDILRIERQSDGVITSTFKTFGFSDAGINPQPKSAAQRRIEAAEFSRLSTEVQRQKFFSLGLPSNFTTGGNASWLIEVFNGTNYHSAFRPTLQSDMPFGMVATTAADVAHIRFFDD